MTTTTNFLRSEEQALLASTVRDLADQHLGSAHVREVMDADGLSRPGWKALAELGLVGLLVPEGHGGAGASTVEAGIVAEELGAVVAPVPFLESAVLATTALLAGGVESDHARHLPGIAAGQVVATLVTAGALHATEVAEGWRLDGWATKVLSGATADLLLVPAVDDDGELHLFSVPGTVTGLERTPLDSLDQTRPLADLSFDRVVAPSEGRLGGEDAGAALDAALVAGAAVLAMEQVGGAARIHRMAVEYAKTRFQFGRAIGSFQAVKHTLADALVALEAGRSLAWHAVTAVADDPEDFEASIAASMAKSWCSEMYEEVAADALQVHGGIGFTWESDVHLFLKRARSSKVLLGSPRTWRRRLGTAIEV